MLPRLRSGFPRKRGLASQRTETPPSHTPLRIPKPIPPIAPRLPRLGTSPIWGTSIGNRMCTGPGNAQIVCWCPLRSRPRLSSPPLPIPYGDYNLLPFGYLTTLPLSYIHPFHIAPPPTTLSPLTLLHLSPRARGNAARPATSYVIHAYPISQIVWNGYPGGRSAVATRLRDSVCSVRAASHSWRARAPVSLHREGVGLFGVECIGRRGRGKGWTQQGCLCTFHFCLHYITYPASVWLLMPCLSCYLV